jgi:hypothetical protein
MLSWILFVFLVIVVAVLGWFIIDLVGKLMAKLPGFPADTVKILLEILLVLSILLWILYRAGVIHG